MTTKLSELRVTQSLDVSAYTAGMASKVSADAAGTASSQKLGATTTDTYQKISRAGNVLDRLSKQYVDGYAASMKFNSALTALGRGIETGNVPLQAADAILDGLYRKFGLVADAAQLQAAGYSQLADTVAQKNAVIAKSADVVTPAVADVAGGMSAIGSAALATSVANDRLISGMSKFGGVVEVTSQQAHGASGQFQALMHSARSMTEGLILGMPPMMILGQQISHLSYVATGPAGLSGALAEAGGMVKAFAGWALGLITPLTAAAGGALAFAGAGYYLATSWEEAQRKTTLALTGIGSVSGVTVTDINRIAIAAASSGKITVGAARDMALEFAATGKIGADLAEKLVGLSEGTGALFNEDQAASAKRLADAFADPAKGVDELNARLAVFDAKTRQRILDLTAENRTVEAQNLLLAGAADATRNAAAQVGVLGAAWEKTKSKISEYLDAAGHVADKALGGGSLEEQLAAAQSQLQKAQGYNFLGIQASPDFIAQLSKRVDDLTARVAIANKTAAEAPGNERSLWLQQALEDVIPTIKQLRDEETKLVALQDRLSDPAALSGAGVDFEQARRAVEIQAERVAGIKLQQSAQETAAEAAKKDNAEALASLYAQTAAQKAALAYQTTLRREQKAGNPAAEIAAQGASAQVLAEAQKQVTDEVRARNLAAAQSIEYAQLELSLVGATADKYNEETAALRARQAVLSQAASEHRTASPAELAAADQQARQQAGIESNIRRSQFLADLDFQKQQLGRTDIDQAVYSKLQSAGLLQNGEIPAQNQFIADRIRLNEELQRSIEIEKGFASDFLSDIMQGKSATEALGNALDNLAQKILNNSLDTLFAGLGKAGGIPTGGLFGGNILPGILHTGGVVGSTSVPTRSVPLAAFGGAVRYHTGGVAGASPFKPGEMPAILQRGEIVLPRGASAAGGGDIHVSLTVPIDAKGADAARLARVEQAVNALPSTMKPVILSAVREAKNRGLV